jgi:hypothetical protein
MIRPGMKVWHRGSTIPMTVMAQIHLPSWCDEQQPEPYFECWYFAGKEILKYHLAESVLMTTLGDES